MIKTTRVELTQPRQAIATKVSKELCGDVIRLLSFPAPRSGLKGRGAQGNFYWRAPMTYFMTSSFVNSCFRWFATFSFAFSSSRLCARRIYSIVSRPWL